MQSSLEAVIVMAHRYGALAEKEAAACNDPEQKKMYEQIAENCKVVPENPPQTFLQAAQLVLFTHDAIMFLCR